MTEFEKQVRKALIDHEMTISDLAEQLDLTVSYVHDILKGKRTPEHQIERIKGVLGLKGGGSGE